MILSKLELLNKNYIKYNEKFHGKEIVFGSGNPDTKILLIGEAPGKDEVRLSKPFVGKAGKQLDQFLEILNIKKESIYITNAIKYRLAKTNPRTGTISNRPATKEELIGSIPYLMREIEIINPEFIVTLGNVPLKAVSGNHLIKIGNVHGEVLPTKIQEQEYKLFALYHPASIIYNRSLNEVYFNDLKKLKDILSFAKIHLDMDKIMVV